MGMRMKSNSLYSLLAVMGLLFAFSGGYLLGQSPDPPLVIFGPGSNMPAETEQNFTPFWHVWNLIHAHFLEQPMDDPLLVEGAINGMLETLEDPNTRYLTPENEAKEREALAGEFQGIGATVEEVDGDIIIVSPLPGSPAETAGLLPGDIMRAADGVDLDELNVDEAAVLVRGPAGTTVILLIERDGILLEFSVDRDLIQIASVTGALLEENIAYVRLNRFGERTSVELEETLNDLSQHNPVGLILDVRRNPGGGLDAAVAVANQFLPEGAVLTQQYGDGRESVLVSDNSGLAVDLPLVVLIDEGSASGSEVVAGAIQDRHRGVLVGQQSFGKGTVQTWHGLRNGGGLRVTTARWLTPSQRWINEQGLTPDHQISVPDDVVLGGTDDAQLAAAVDLLLATQVEDAPDGAGE